MEKIINKIKNFYDREVKVFHSKNDREKIIDTIINKKKFEDFNLHCFLDHYYEELLNLDNKNIDVKKIIDYLLPETIHILAEVVDENNVKRKEFLYSFNLEDNPVRFLKKIEDNNPYLIDKISRLYMLNENFLIEKITDIIFDIVKDLQIENINKVDIYLKMLEKYNYLMYKSKIEEDGDDKDYILLKIQEELFELILNDQSVNDYFKDNDSLILELMMENLLTIYTEKKEFNLTNVFNNLLNFRKNLRDEVFVNKINNFLIIYMKNSIDVEEDNDSNFEVFKKVNCVNILKDIWMDKISFEDNNISLNLSTLISLDINNLFQNKKFLDIINKLSEYIMFDINENKNTYSISWKIKDSLIDERKISVLINNFFEKLLYQTTYIITNKKFDELFENFNKELREQFLFSKIDNKKNKFKTKI